MSSRSVTNDAITLPLPEIKGSTDDITSSDNLTSSSESNSKKRPADAHLSEASKDNRNEYCDNIASNKMTKVENAQTSETSCNNHIDVASDLKLAEGTRVQVRWEVSDEIRWWGGILLPPQANQIHVLKDEDDEVCVPIRQIDYDPYIEGGFPDRSVESVCFLSDHSLLVLSEDTRAFWRKEGDLWEPTNEEEDELKLIQQGEDETGVNSTSDDEISISSSSPEDALQLVLNTVLQTALQKTGIMDKMGKLPASQQGFIAERIARAKEKLKNKLLEQAQVVEGGLERVITKENVLQCMQELRGDL